MPGLLWVYKDFARFQNEVYHHFKSFLSYSSTSQLPLKAQHALHTPRQSTNNIFQLTVILSTMQFRSATSMVIILSTLCLAVDAMKASKTPKFHVCTSPIRISSSQETSNNISRKHQPHCDRHLCGTPRLENSDSWRCARQPSKP